jgi:xylulokinase
MPLYVGFDSSTQSLTATVIDVTAGSRRVVFEDVIVFDEAFPRYATTRGVNTEGAVVTAPPRMWAEALEAMMGRLRDAVDVSQIAAVSGSGQQHGSVYLTADAGRLLADLDPTKPLAPQLEGAFSRPRSPVWLDCSTTQECAALNEAAGGDRALAALTGSRAYERFTASQIRKFAERDPDAYARTARIHLVSSFMASLLCGCDAPLEPGDGSGMNLMDIGTRKWSALCLAATAPDLERRLPPLGESWTVAGQLSRYWRDRFGFPAAPVIAWSGDNPCSLIGLGLIAEGDLGISLGTSDTVFAPTPKAAPDPRGAGHLFGSPAGGYMALTCFANGSLARERIRDEHGLDWRAFSACLAETPPGNNGALMIPWFVPEITPTTAAVGPHRQRLDAADTAANVRAVVEGQAMAMRLYSGWFAPRVRTIRATGGAAANAAILQIVADVFDAEVVRIAPPNAASLGAALRAYHGERLAAGRPVSWDEAVADFTAPRRDEGAAPRPEAARQYADLLPRYEAFVRAVLTG